MKKASIADKPVVNGILVESFKNDPHINWLLEKSKNKSKLDILFNYIFNETISKGEIYLSADNNAVALWDSENKEKLSLWHVCMNLSFLFKIGTSSVIRMAKSDKKIHDNLLKHPKYLHLLLIGVMPKFQGKGLGSALIDPRIKHMQEQSIPVLLETANPRNVEYYKKKGFIVYDTIDENGHIVFLMRFE